MLDVVRLAQQHVGQHAILRAAAPVIHARRSAAVDPALQAEGFGGRGGKGCVHGSTPRIDGQRTLA